MTKKEKEEMEQKKEISTRSSKNEILDAYNELLEKVKEEKTVDRQVEKKKEEEKEVVKGALQLSVEKIIKGMADTKLDIGQLFDGLEERLVTRYKVLTELQQAIDIETKRLEEVHEIKINADSLAALILAQKQRKIEFESEIEKKRTDIETEMTEKRSQWKKEQDLFEFSKKEREAQTKKERERAEEEYSYNLQLKRKKDNDAYETRKAAMEKELVDKKTAVEKELTDKKAVVEKELSERESAISSREEELIQLKSEVNTFPKQLEKAVKDTEKAITEKLEITYKHQAELATKEMDGERKLYKQTIQALEAKIKDQDAQIRQLTQKSSEAGQQVQHIAIKAIEGASSQRMMAMSYEKRAEETAKGKE